jgi:uncharacterized membrane protein YcaP (DUF421 family)
MSPIFFDSWMSLGRVLVIGVLAYVALVLTLRVSRKRTLTKLNAFDLVVTVALGSVLATVLLSKDVALAEGVLAIAVLISLQYAITWGSVRSPWFSGVIKSEPTLLVRGGTFIDSAMRKQRLTRQEVLAALRRDGVRTLEEAEAVILETDGSISVITKPGVATTGNALANILDAKDP